MKKVFFGATALLFSGAIFAQANQTSLQDINGGVSVDATVVAPLPGSAAGGNTGLSVQNGTDNKVYVAQAGTEQSAYTNQANGSGNGDNRARIWQTGAVTAASGVGNAADVDQLGSGNQSTTRQEGDLNEAVTKQGIKDGGASTYNKAYIRQGTGQNAEQNYAMVEQDGENNTSKTVQIFDNSQARTVQEGNDNMADIRQDAGPNQSAGHSALVEQYGDENASRVRQYGSARNKAHSVQVGTGNKINQNQWSDAASGVGNTADANQGATPIINTNLYSTVHTALNALDDITPGSFNPGSVGGKGLQNQYGENNEAFLEQFGSSAEAGNYAEQNQDGKDNDAAIFQNEFGNSNGGGNRARQDQLGEANVAGIAQLGVDHRAYQRQYGDSNIALSTQRGNSNLVSTYQDGDANVVNTSQRGQDNQILVVQRAEDGYGGHSYTVNQGLGGNPHSGNQANILQLGPNGDVNGDHPGCDFQDPQDLEMPGGVNGFNLEAPCGGGNNEDC